MISKNILALALLIAMIVIGEAVIGVVVGAVSNTGTNISAKDKQQNVQTEVQEPNYTASIKVPQGVDNEKQEVNETQEAKILAGYAKITPKQAEAAALAKVPGKVVKVQLENENGNVVYSVEIATGTGIKDVKVDAGNGHVLYIDTGNDHESTTEVE